MKHWHELIKFSHFLSGHEGKQAQIKKATNPGEMIEFAKISGFGISLDDLSNASGNLTASYWAWTGKTKEWCSSFFDQQLINDNI